MFGLYNSEEITTLALFVLIQYRRVTDKQTDGWTRRSCKDHTMHSIMWVKIWLQSINGYWRMETSRKDIVSYAQTHGRIDRQRHAKHIASDNLLCRQWKHKTLTVTLMIMHDTGRGEHADEQNLYCVHSSYQRNACPHLPCYQYLPCYQHMACLHLPCYHFCPLCH